MFRLIRLFNTSIGKKLVMAVTGLALLLFLIGHMLGNMKVFQGPDSLNEYAAWLQGHPLLWAFRISMLVLVALHLYTALSLTRENWGARPQAYRKRHLLRTSLTGRLMLVSGLFVLAFLIYHLLHLTLGVVDPASHALLDAQGRPDVFGRVVAGFRQPWLAGIYLAALALLGLHLNHAVQSLFQTLGFNHESYQALIQFGSPALSLVLVLGFGSVPGLIWLGWVG